MKTKDLFPPEFIKPEDILHTGDTYTNKNGVKATFVGVTADGFVPLWACEDYEPDGHKDWLPK